MNPGFSWNNDPLITLVIKLQRGLNVGSRLVNRFVGLIGLAVLSPIFILGVLGASFLQRKTTKFLMKLNVQVSALIVNEENKTKLWELHKKLLSSQKETTNFLSKLASLGTLSFITRIIRNNTESYAEQVTLLELVVRQKLFPQFGEEVPGAKIIDLRQSLNRFAEDWDDEEMDSYDQRAL